MAARAGAEIRVALAGFGAIGAEVAQVLDRGIPGLRLVAISARDADAAATRAARMLSRPVPA